MNTVFASKFVTILKTYTEEELKSFDLWLKSPWCNNNKNLIRLFEKLKKYHPDYNNSKLTKEKLFKQVLPNGKFSLRRMNNLLSEAYLTAERFLTFYNFTLNDNLQKDLLTKAFQNRHLENWFLKDVNKEISQLEQKKIKTWEEHLALFQLHSRVYHHPNQNPLMQPGGQTIVRMGEEIDLIYLLEKALIINEKIFRNRILKNENHEIDSDIKKWRIAAEGIENRALELYRMRFDYTKENKQEQYLKLREAFLKQYEELTEKDQKVHFVSLLNDSTLLIREGKLELSEVLPLYKNGLETGNIFHQGILTHRRYTAIVASSNIGNNFSFSNNFINTYTNKLEKDYQSDAYNWASAHTAYYEKKLTQCLDILLSHHFKVEYFLLISKVLTTQVYFDLYLQNDSYQDYLLNYFDSFEKMDS